MKGHGERHAARLAVHRRWWGSGRAVLIRAMVSLITVLTVTNIVGAVATFVVAVYVVPEPHAFAQARQLNTDIVVASIYLVVATVVGIVMGVRRLSSLADWLP